MNISEELLPYFLLCFFA